jgi:hypothetical protein
MYWSGGVALPVESGSFLPEDLTGTLDAGDLLI